MAIRRVEPIKTQVYSSSGVDVRGAFGTSVTKGGMEEPLRKLLNARHPLIHIPTVEEDHALGLLVAATVELQKPMFRWSVVHGVVEGMLEGEHSGRPDTEHPAGALRWFGKDALPRVFVMLDVLDHLNEPVTMRALREAIGVARQTKSTIVLLDRQHELPAVLSAEAVRHDILLPDTEEIQTISMEHLRRLREDEHIDINMDRKTFDLVIQNLRGLTRAQIRTVLSDVALADQRFEASDLDGIRCRKRQFLCSGGLLEEIQTEVPLEDVAGMQHLKAWLAARREALLGVVPGLDAPRAMLLLGVPGAGKSHAAKAIATAWRLPLLRLDAGVLFDRYVGESERRLREALRQAEAMSPLVLWIDEIEKAFASAASHSTDGGLSKRMFGSLLTWMQERRAPVFMVATANDIAALPPEMLRKGRFDEIFFVDLPSAEERNAIFRIHLRRRELAVEDFDLSRLVTVTEGWSGAEIEAAIRSMLFDARTQGVKPGTFLLSEAIRATVPLSATMAGDIERLRAWAKGRTVPA